MSDNRHYQLLDQRTYASAVACLMLFVFVHIYEGYWIQALAGFGACLVICLLAWRLSANPTYEESRTLRLTAWASILMMLCFTIQSNTLGSTYFTFPLMLSAWIVFPKGLAFSLNIVTAVLTTILATRWLLPLDLFRYSTSQLFVICVGYVYAAVIERNQDELAQLANTDPLTKILNRHELHHQLNHALANCRRYDRPACLIMIDLDHFKGVNDTHGHLVGDQVLIEICDIIKHRIRESDLLFRYGGEEFALLLPNETLDQAQAVAENLRDNIAKQTLTEQIVITASFGVAEAHPEDSDQSLLKRADAALYQAKQCRNEVRTLCF
ncbi:MAG: hypothetical protein CL693_03515 [Cellvibrionaceae bacterium]|nr:hypothetical protein [Cellvibrionaceae bacterium]